MQNVHRRGLSTLFVQNTEQYRSELNDSQLGLFEPHLEVQFWSGLAGPMDRVISASNEFWIRILVRRSGLSDLPSIRLNRADCIECSKGVGQVIGGRIVDSDIPEDSGYKLDESTEFSRRMFKVGRDGIENHRKRVRLTTELRTAHENF